MARQGGAGGEITAAFSGGGGIAGTSTARTTPVASPYQVTDALHLLPLPSTSSSACVQLKLTVVTEIVRGEVGETEIHHSSGWGLGGMFEIATMRPRGFVGLPRSYNFGSN
jgi:hypothetical protein